MKNNLENRKQSCRVIYFLLRISWYWKVNWFCGYYKRFKRVHSLVQNSFLRFCFYLWSICVLWRICFTWKTIYRYKLKWSIKTFFTAKPWFWLSSFELVIEMIPSTRLFVHRFMCSVFFLINLHFKYIHFISEDVILYELYCLLKSIELSTYHRTKELESTFNYINVQ